MTSSVTSVPAVGGQAVHVEGVGLGELMRRSSQIQSLYCGRVGERRLLVGEQRRAAPATSGRRCRRPGTPRPCRSTISIVPPLSAAAASRPLDDLGHELVARRMGERRRPSRSAGISVISPAARDSGLAYDGANAQRHGDLEALEVVAELFADRHEVGERLRRVVDVALQVDDRHVGPRATSRMYVLPSFGTRSWRIAMPWPIATGCCPCPSGSRRGDLRSSRRRGSARGRRAASCPPRRRCECGSTCRGRA